MIQAILIIISRQRRKSILLFSIYCFFTQNIVAMQVVVHSPFFQFRNKKFSFPAVLITYYNFMKSLILFIGDIFKFECYIKFNFKRRGEEEEIFPCIKRKSFKGRYPFSLQFTGNQLFASRRLQMLSDPVQSECTVIKINSSRKRDKIVFHPI